MKRIYVVFCAELEIHISTNTDDWKCAQRITDEMHKLFPHLEWDYSDAEWAQKYVSFTVGA